VLFSYGYNIETCKIIGATSLRLHFWPYVKLLVVKRGAWPKWISGKYASGRDADLYMAQLMPMPLTISCSSKSRLVLPFGNWLTRVVPDKVQRAIKQL